MLSLSSPAEHQMVARRQGKAMRWGLYTEGWSAYYCIGDNHPRGAVIIKAGRVRCGGVGGGRGCGVRRGLTGDTIGDGKG